MVRRSHWTCGTRVWLENSGRAVLGRGRVELLEAIEMHHSLRQAAASLGISYRRAWLMVQSMNAAAGQPLVEASTGGKEGGRSQLTPFARSAMKTFRRLDMTIHRAVERYLQSL